jgi:hypothetical protein
MALIALVATTTDDHNALQSTLDRLLAEHGVSTAPVAAPSVQAQPAPSSPSVPSVVAGTIARPAQVSGWKSLYSTVAHQAGLASLERHHKDAVKALIPNVGDVASMADAVAAVRAAGTAPVVPSVDVTPTVTADPIAAERQRLMAELDALNGQQAQVQPAASTTPKLSSVPPVSALNGQQVANLREWAQNFTPIRQSAILAYCDGRLPWADVLSTGVKSEKALRKINA